MTGTPRLRWRRVVFDEPYKKDSGFVLEELVNRNSTAEPLEFRPFWRAVEAFGVDEESMTCAIVARWPDEGVTLVDYTELDRNRRQIDALKR